MTAAHYNVYHLVHTCTVLVNGGIWAESNHRFRPCIEGEIIHHASALSGRPGWWSITLSFNRKFAACCWITAPHAGYVYETIVISSNKQQTKKPLSVFTWRYYPTGLFIIPPSRDYNVTLSSDTTLAAHQCHKELFRTQSQWTTIWWANGRLHISYPRSHSQQSQ